MMNWKSGTLVGLAIFVGLGLLWCFGSVGKDAPVANTSLVKSMASESSSSAVRSQPSVGSSARSMPALDKRRIIASGSAGDPPVPAALSAYICEGCKPSPFVAKSPAEAAWMKRAGFPTPEMRKDMETLPMDMLKAKADAGDLATMAVYGIRLAQMGSVLDGELYLLRAQFQGSIYACYGLAQVYQQPSPYQDWYAAASEIRLAMLLGDARASDYLYRTFPQFDAGAFAGIDNDASVKLHRLMNLEYKLYGSYNELSIRPMDYDDDNDPK